MLPAALAALASAAPPAAARAPLPAPAAAALLLAAAAALAVAAAAALLLRAELQFRRLPLPSPRMSGWLLGHAPPMISERSPENIAAWVAACGPILKLRLLHEVVVLVTDPAAVVKINRVPGTTKPDLYRAFDLPSIKRASMFSDAGSPYWKAVRVGVAPCFSMTSLKRTFPWLLRLTSMAADEVAAAAAAGEAVDVADLAARVTSDTIGDMMFSQDLGGMARAAELRAAAAAGAPPPPPPPGTDFIAVVRGYLSAVHKRLNDPLFGLRFGAAKRAAVRAIWRWDEAIGEVAHSVVKSPPPEYTIASHLLRVVDPGTGKALTPRQVKSELSIFYIAGFETTSHAITWTLGLLASHPAVQERLAAELATAGLAPRAAPAKGAAGSAAAAAAGGAAGGAARDDARGGGQADTAKKAAAAAAADSGGGVRCFEWGDLGRLPYLGAVIKESLRLYQPAAGGSARQLGADVEVLGVTLPKGTSVAEPLYALGRADFNYHDPDTFRPERWQKAAGGGGGGEGEAEGDGGGAGVPDALPFAVGPRDCIGQTLAMLELQAVLATLVGRFEWRLPEGARGAEGTLAALQAVLCYHITLFPRDGLRLAAAPRAPVAL